MSKLLITAHALNWLLLLILMLATIGFISFLNFYGFFLALVTISIAWGIFKHNRWAYFSAAVWALACYQLAKQGYEFQAIKRYVMTLGIILIPVSLFLHEVLGKAVKLVVKNSGVNK